MAEYYLCSVGDVYKAALPTGLKPESTTLVALNQDAEEVEGYNLSDRESMIVQLLQSEKKISIAEIQKNTGLQNATSTIHRLMEKGVVEIFEKVVERYRPKSEKMVRLALDGVNPAERHDKIHDFMNLTARSPKQERMLLAYLDLSQCLARDSEAAEVSRKELLEKSGGSPAILKSLIDKGILQQYSKAVNPFKKDVKKAVEIPFLSPAQQKAHAEIIEAFKTHSTALLHGVTGSGKTEIYSHLINATLHAGYSVLFLVPEISLTTQLTDRLRRIFGDRLLVYHSKFSDYERVEVWNTVLHTDQPRIILGARSAVFLPIRRLGLVIIDEEHESSYKQFDPAPRYNARDTAIMLASMHGAKTLLGSATPAIDTYYKAKNGKYGLITLSERFENATLPEVNIVDMRDQRKRKLINGIFSSPLRLATDSALDSGRQALFFQNRRGFAPYVVCRNCGWTPRCINCDVALVYHKYSDQLRCHYCGYAIQRPAVCPACQENSVEVYGYGTERIAEDTATTFPNAKVLRMDLDTTRNKDAYQEIIEDFSTKNTDILVGTQMLSKGLDFENVTVVGVLNADSLLNFPDFRCNERAFNMLEQVAGRAGRRLEKG
ncbi:MAG: primosomal protein N', partial [Muribaculaceae bacterium]|nr:primosomal protein N' [Muribaculaceae bacterium]